MKNELIPKLFEVLNTLQTTGHPISIKSDDKNNIQQIVYNAERGYFNIPLANIISISENDVTYFIGTEACVFIFWKQSTIWHLTVKVINP